MSATHSTFGAAGRNYRSTRSSATRTPGTRIVVPFETQEKASEPARNVLVNPAAVAYVIELVGH
jgi:hypothetical protein